MSKTTAYEELIAAGIKGLPQELLAEIADFVYVVRKKFTQPNAFERELTSTLLNDPSPEAVPQAKGWQSLAGSISADDLQLMSDAIAEGCEQIDSDEW